MKRLVVCVVLVGCAGDDSGGGGGPLALEDFGNRLADISCEKIFDCCTDAEIMEQFMNITSMGEPITTEEQCVAFYAGILNGFALPQWQASIAAGRMEYDANAAGGCASGVESLSCSEYSALSSSNSNTSLAGTCQPFLIAKVDNSGACAHDDECISDNCVGGSSDTDGTCEPMPGAGEPCDSNCVDGYYCGYDSTQSADICIALEANGAECTVRDECMSDYCDSTVSPSVCATKAPTCDGR